MHNITVSKCKISANHTIRGDYIYLSIYVQWGVNMDNHSSRDTIDKNFVIDTTHMNGDMEIRTCFSPEFDIYGNCQPYTFCRISDEIEKDISIGVRDRAKRCAGMRMRFCTDSGRLGIKVRFDRCVQFSSQTALSSKGFDLYCDGAYYRSFVPPEEADNEFEQILEIAGGELHGYELVFPYNSVMKELYVGIDKNSSLQKGKPYRNILPIVFYGSSLTHGFCASRPGNTFTAMISRKLNVDYINLGFSGACLAEEQMAQYLAGVKKSLLVCEYDYNESDISKFEENHIRFYKKIRSCNDDSPILFITKPIKSYMDNENKKRIVIAKRTVDYAKSIGDNNVYLINGNDLFPSNNAVDCLVDGAHPNDLGTFFMADVIGNKIAEILNIK